MKLAFGTVACPHWTLERLASVAGESAYDGVELRTFLDTPERIVCEPSLTGGTKLREMFADEGVALPSIASGVSFDEPIFPPIVGRAIMDNEKSVRACQRAIGLADEIKIPMIRVFGYAVPKRNSRVGTIRRIGQRARLAVDRADKRGVRVCFENGGDFATAADLVELIKATGPHPLIAACYAPAVAARAGESIADAIALLGPRLKMVRLTDVKDGVPCTLGDGDEPTERVVHALAEANFDGWVVFDWPKVWMPDLGEPDEVLAKSAERLHGWLGTSRGVLEAHPEMASA